MPLYARLAQYLLFVVLTAMAAWCARVFILDNHNVMMLVFFIWLCATIVGLYRRVAWGRFYVSCVSVLSAFTIALSMIPFDPYRLSEQHAHTLHGIINLSPLLAWLLVVATAVLVLLPALLIGIRKDWFRSAWW
ncbi:hypothetical protein [Massilia rubra]|uniref:Uncharacterized protein n=1 Tax=Massilia rubra TaxID=2607910 RepID=A0ABX0LUM0_9BURK|nr:hypothetical protein [Massilia rubra]NHZ36438.1 hypothetical protein [Massilia rubra]